MRVISAKQLVRGANSSFLVDVSDEQARLDYPEVLRRHNEACQDDPWWSFFGGIITIQGREYQVV